MAVRRKSYRKIQKQLQRINAAGYNSPRLRQANAIGNRYLDNIRNSRAFKNDEMNLESYAEEAYQKGYENAGRVVQRYAATGTNPAEYDFIVNRDAFPKLAERAYKREYTRSEYAGGAGQSRFANVRSAAVNVSKANVGG